jgi:hypothetical protein
MSTDNIIREVDEELRRDRMRQFWRQFGPWLIVAAVAVVLGVAGYEGWNWWTKTQAARSSDQFYAATKIADGTDVAAAKKALDDVIAQGSGGYPMLAQFREASLLASQGKVDEAVAAYDALGSSIANTHLRELALVLGASLLIDKGDIPAVEQRVGGSMTPASPMRNAAREVMGLVQYKAGKLDDAMKSFQAIIDDPAATRDTQSRVQIYMLQLEAEGAKPITPPADATTPSSPPTDASSAAPPASGSSASAAPSAPPSSETSSAAPVASSAPVSSEASTAVESSAELDVTPPVVIDNSLLSMAAPGASSAASSEAAPASSAAVSSAPIASSSAP